MLNGHTTSEGYVVKLSPGGGSSDGTPAFEKSISVTLWLSNLTELFNGAQDADENHVLVGQSNSTAHENDQKNIRTHGVANATGDHGMEDGYLVKLDSNGEVVSDANGVPYQRWFSGNAQDKFEGVCETGAYYSLNRLFKVKLCRLQ
jgi:hypothetical protein